MAAMSLTPDAIKKLCCAPPTMLITGTASDCCENVRLVTPLVLSQLVAVRLSV
jgi:hypothetical protein